MKEFLFDSKTFVILDNGHGIDTPGKRSPVWSDGTQLFEYEFTRDIVGKISEWLKFGGISHCILVPEVTNNTTWAGLTTMALCAHSNDWNNV